MKTKYDGLIILLCVFAGFFLLAGIGLVLDKYYGWSEPDLELYYDVVDGKLVQRKGGI